MTSTSTTTTERDESREPRARRPRAGLVGIVGGIVAALAVATPAVAAQPIVVDEGTYDNLYDVPAEAFPCGVEVTFHEVGSYRTTHFFDRDGTFLREQFRIGGTTTITSEHGEIVNRWRHNGRLDPDGTLTLSGNSYNLQGGAGGILANVGGHWVLDGDTGELLSAAGPQDGPEANLEEICAVLSP